MTAVGPISVIHIDGDDDSDEVDEAVQLTDDESQRSTVISHSTNNTPVCYVTFYLSLAVVIEPIIHQYVMSHFACL